MNAVARIANDVGESKRTIRHPDFAKRLNQAADAHSQCPDLHHGRLGWIVRQFQERYEQTVTSESVRKWFAGEARPFRQNMMAHLAEILEVDQAWLAIGTDPVATARERRVRNAMANGAVNLVAGLIQLDGGTVAYPPGDSDVDLHAIIRGEKYDIHVCLAEKAGRRMRYDVPAKNADLFVIGVFRQGLELELFEIPEKVVAAGNRRGGSIEVEAARSELRKIESFTKPL